MARLLSLSVSGYNVWCWDGLNGEVASATGSCGSRAGADAASAAAAAIVQVRVS